jgi:hypothetical protein
VSPSPDQRIRELCSNAVTATDLAEIEAVAIQLRAELHAYMEALREQTAKEIPLIFHPQNEAAD